MSQKRSSSIADRLGEVRAQIATLIAEEEKLKRKLIESGDPVIEGKLFRVTVSQFTVTRVDYKGVVEKLHPSNRLLKSYTTEAEVTKVNVTSRLSS